MKIGLPMIEILAQNHPSPQMQAMASMTLNSVHSSTSNNTNYNAVVNFFQQIQNLY